MFLFGVVSTLVAVGAIWYAYAQRAKIMAYVANVGATIKTKI